MRYKKLDLNLLVALDVLLTEKNVSRAAEKLCLSQSATSGALARLREYFQDELLVQVGRKMILTPRANILHERVRNALLQIDGTIIQEPEFDKTTVERKINIVASDYVAIAALAEAIRAIKTEAPGLSFRIQNPDFEPGEKLRRGEVDFLVLPELNIEKDQPFTHLFKDDYVIVMCANNSLYGESISEKEFYDAEHISAQFDTRTPSYETWFMKNGGSERKITATANTFTVVPYLLINTNHIALMHRRLANIFTKQLPIRAVPCPIDIPPIVEGLQWNTHNNSDACLTWVRKTIIANQ